MDERAFVEVARTGEIAADKAKAITVGGRSILIVNHDGRFFAVENRCSHADQPLDCGRIRWGWIACPAHGARFDLETGEPMNPPATAPIATFPLRVTGDAIEIAV